MQIAYKIIKKGTGKKPQNGDKIFINYAGFLENGELFDSCLEDVSKIFGKFDQRRCDAKQYIPIPFEAGKKDGMIPGFIEENEKLSFGRYKSTKNLGRYTYYRTWKSI